MLGFPELIERVPKEMKKRYGQFDQPLIKSPFGPSLIGHGAGRAPDVLIIEDKGSGVSLRQMLAREGIPAYPYNPGRASKLERLHAISHVIASGMVWLVESENVPGQPKSWYDPFIQQMCEFSGEGSVKHDEMVDCTSQAIRYITDRNLIRVTTETNVVELPRRRTMPGERVNPYAV
jgi:hypothetical protein